MALTDIVTVGKALQKIAAMMKNEPTMNCVGVTLSSSRLSRHDIEYLAHVASKELPCTVGYSIKNGVATVTLTRKEEE
ncbi:MAG: hypothetical protein IJ085_02975 [Turicibacter sp.]|nr:hypothetical protein [Turicibacter sp.]